MDLWNNDIGLILIDNVYFRLNNTTILENMRLAVYLTEEAKEKYKMNMLGLMFNELSEEQHKYWREILAENFDYDKYGN